MNGAHEMFQGKRVILSTLKQYGFNRDGTDYIYHHTMKEENFRLTVRITENGDVFAQIIDLTFNEPYVLHLANGAVGSFVGNIRQEYEDVLGKISIHCFEQEIFKAKQTKELITYVRNTYGDELEYLWQKFPNSAVWRRKDNKKWYAAILTVSERKLGFNTDNLVEIIDLRYPKKELEELIDGKKYLPGWHMNKKHWYSIILNESVSIDDIYRKLDLSYVLAGS